VRDLELRALATQNGKIFVPVELECLARAKRQRNEGAAACRLLLSLAICAPLSGEGCQAVVASGEAERDQISMHPLQGPPLLTRLPRLSLQPACQLVGKRIKFAGPLRRRKARLDRPRVQILLDRIARHSGPPCALAERQLLS
jgi:hypothetical protein